MIIAALLVVSILVAGATVLVNGRRHGIVDAAILAPAVGFGALSLGFFAWRFLLRESGAGFAPIAWLLVLGVVALEARRWIIGFPKPLRRLRRPRPSAALLATAVFVSIVVLQSGWVLTRRNPFGAFDAWAIWSSRARLLYLSPDLTTVFATLHSPHPDYPLFLPGTLAAQFSMAGGVSDWVPVWTGVVFLLATSAAVALGVRRLGGSRELAGAAAVLLLATPMFTTWGFAQCADLPLAYVLTLAALGLSLLVAETRDVPYRAGTVGFLAGLLAWAKNEGMILSLLLLGLYALFALRSGAARKHSRAVALAAAIPWAATLTFKLGWRPHTNLPTLFASPWSNALSLERWQFVGVSFWERLDPVGGFSHWGLVWTVAAGCLLLGARARAWRARPIAFLLLALMACWATWFGIFLATPHDVAWQVRTALDRLMLQLLPVTLMTGLASLPIARADGSVLTERWSYAVDGLQGAAEARGVAAHPLGAAVPVRGAPKLQITGRATDGPVSRRTRQCSS